MIKYQLRNVGKEKGAALMIIVFILAIALMTYILKSMNTQAIKVDHQQLVRKNLNIAKEALIAWAVANKDYPGQMPYPDRGTDVAGYDGKSDCSGSNPINNQSLLIGQLPMYGSTGCISFSITEGLATEVDDGYGNRLWYAVSPNLLHNYAPTGAQTSDPMINSDTMDTATWLRVLDHNGNLISDRVAVVIMSPGEALGTQSRSANATPNHYLDTYQKGGNTYSNSNYDTFNEDFIMGKPVSAIDADDTSYTRPYVFNDQLVYITIDELMVALEKRVGEEARHALKAYENANGNYPYASKLGASGYAGSTPSDSGLLPVYQTCNLDLLNRKFSCEQPIFDDVVSGINEIIFSVKNPSLFSDLDNQNGSCTIESTNKECHCTGNGYCRSSASGFEFACDIEDRECTVTGAETELTAAIAQIELEGGYFQQQNNSCTITGAVFEDAVSGCPLTSAISVLCDSSLGDGDVSANPLTDESLGAYLPNWFIENQWQNHVYYHMTRPSAASLFVGAQSTDAVIITTGARINNAPFAVSKSGAQNRPSCNNLRDFLDSVENADGGPQYDAASTQRSTNFNDQMFIAIP